MRFGGIEAAVVARPRSPAKQPPPTLSHPRNNHGSGRSPHRHGMKHNRMLTLAAALLVCACSSAGARVAVDCLAPRLTPSSLVVGDGSLDRGFPGGVSLVDVDGDGDLDLMATRGYSPIARPLLRYDRSMLYRNDGAGHFTHDTTSVLSNADNPASGSTWGDVDGDGDLRRPFEARAERRSGSASPRPSASSASPSAGPTEARRS